MKGIVFLLTALLVGCASSYRVNPSKVDFALVDSASQWQQGSGTVHIPIRITNDSRAVLEIGVDAAPGVPAVPVMISWLYYQVLAQDGRVDAAHGPGGHGPMPPKMLRIGPGDSAVIVAAMYGLTANDCSRAFQIRFRDLEDNWYTTDAFSPCATP